MFVADFLDTLQPRSSWVTQTVSKPFGARFQLLSAFSFSFQPHQLLRCVRNAFARAFGW